MQKFDLLPFQAPHWAAGGHSQTILGDVLPSKPLKSEGERLLVELENNDKLVCRLYKGTSPFVIVMFHGLTGNAQAGYMQRIGKHLLQQGHGLCLVNHRNCGEGFGLSKKPYHAGCSDDMGRIIFDLRQILPSKTIVAVGFSMSGNALLLLSAGVIPGKNIFHIDKFKEESRRFYLSQPDYIISVNPPVNLKNSQENFKKSINVLYEWNFVRQLKNLGSQMPDKEFFANMKPVYKMSLKEFDDVYTSKRSGFADANDYYNKCSAANYLQSAAVPTVVLTSQDDPFINYKDFDQCKKSPAIDWYYSSGGGHMGYLHKQKLPNDSFRWMDYAVVELKNQMTT